MNTGLIIHPSVSDLTYARHDVSGLYRWDPSNNRWIQLMDGFPMDWNKARGCDGFAVDTAAGANTTRQNTIYAAFGEVSLEGVDWLNVAEASGIWRSTDQGDTWTKIWDGVVTIVNGNRILSYAANADLRMHGEPIALDPLNHNVFYAGTRNDGLYRSFNIRTASPTFSKISNAPKGLINSTSQSTGIRTVLIDPRGGSVGSGSNLRSKIVYLGVPEGPDKGVYRSTNGGNSFQLVSTTDANKNNLEMDFGPGNSIFVSGGRGDGVRKFDGSSWSTLSQTASISAEFRGMATDPNNRSRIVAEAARELWYSENGGASWHRKPSWQHDMLTYKEDWNSTKLTTAFTLEFDPHNPNRVLHGNSWGVDEYVDVSLMKTSNPVVVRPLHRGLATTVSMDICVPKAGKLLYNPAADMGGFIHPTDLSVPSLETLTDYLFLDTEGGSARSSILSDVEVAPTDPKFVAISRSTDIGFTSAKTKIYLSSDFGDNWNEFDLPPVSVMPSHGSTAIGNGKMCISSSDPNRIIFVGSNRYPHYCTNAFSGNQPNWQESTGTDWLQVTVLPWFPDTFRLAADPNNGMRFFYAYKDPGGNNIKLYRSSNGGASWQVPSGQSGLGKRVKTLSMDTCKNASGNTEIWISGMRRGARANNPGIPLKRSVDGGVTFNEVNPDILDVYAFAFGKSAAGSNVPAVFVAGHIRINGAERSGFFISDDFGQTFRQMTEEGVPLADGFDLDLMEGDPNVYGRVFFSSHGKGLVYSETAGSGGTNQEMVYEAENLPATRSAPLTNIFDGSASNGQWERLDSTGNGQWVRYTINVSNPGIFEVKVRGKIGSDRAKMRLEIDGERIGTWDQFSSNSSFAEHSFGDVEFSAPGNYEFTFKTATRNANSNGWRLSIDRVSLVSNSGSTGGGGLSFEAEALNPGNISASNPSAVVEKSSAGASGGKMIAYYASGSGQWIEYTPNVAAGAHRLKVQIQENAYSGRYRLRFNGVNVGIHNFYNSNSEFVEYDFGTVTSTGGEQTLRFECLGKHSNSNNFRLMVDKIAFE